MRNSASDAVLNVTVIPIWRSETAMTFSSCEDASRQPFFAAIERLRPGEAYLSPVGQTMVFAMPVYQPGGEKRPPAFQGAVVLDFPAP